MLPPALHYVELNLTSRSTAFYDFLRREEPKLVVERSFGKRSRKRISYIMKYAILKDKDRAFREMTPDFRKTCQRDITFSHHLAGIFTLLGEEKEALDWLENAVNRGFINYPLLAEKDPWLTNLRGEPRFKKLMKQVKYEWEHLEV